MNENQLFILLQVNDAQFPIGGYSHSYGLETYIQKNIVNDPESALAFMESSIMNSFLYSELLPARLAYEYALEGKLDKILELEEIVEASKSPVEIRLVPDLSKQLSAWTATMFLISSPSMWQRWKILSQLMPLLTAYSVQQ